MLKTTILYLLLICHRNGQTLPRPIIKAQCEQHLGGKIGEGDFAAALGELQDKQLITYLIDPLSDDRKYHLTEQGRIAAG